MDNVEVKEGKAKVEIMNRIGNSVAKGEMADNEQVVLFPTVFSYASTNSSKCL